MRKLSMSGFADNLILKGGLQIYIMTNFESRATIDADFLLRNLPNDKAELEKIINEIINVETGNDFVELTAESFDIISQQRKYAGVTCKITGKIKNTKTPFTVDFGVGDVIVPSPVKRNIPVQLEEFDSPMINTYSIESTVAEKFESAIEKMELNSRMKDFYDIYYLAHIYDFDGRILQEAIYRTLERRLTPYERDSLKCISEMGNDPEMNNRWVKFLRQLKQDEPDLKSTIDFIVDFLKPIWYAIVNEDEFFGSWSSADLVWN